MTDDFALLADFRSEIREPDDKAALRIYRLATAAKPWPKQPLRGLRPLAPRALIIASIIGLILIPTALAFGGRIVDLFTGMPAPRSVSSNFVRFNRMADLATQEGFATKLPHADVEKARGVIEITTAEGLEDMWVAPSDRGGRCWFVDFAADSPGADGQPGFGGCDPVVRPASEINWGSVWIFRHPSLITVFGHVYVNAVSVQVTLKDGSATTLPLVKGMFLGTFRKGARVTHLVAFNWVGHEVAKVPG